jgi:hypothetical protein
MIVDEKELELKIETIRNREGDGYLSAIVTLCEENDIEPAFVAKMLSKPMKEKLKLEGEDLNLLKKSSRLPL